jgi:hypothetical protein
MIADADEVETRVVCEAGVPKHLAHLVGTPASNPRPKSTSRCWVTSPFNQEPEGYPRGATLGRGSIASMDVVRELDPLKSDAHS